MKIRKPAVAGMFYPNDKIELLENLEFLFQQAENIESISVSAEIKGIISPHAGYIYSGKTAAKAYYYLKNSKINKVIVISPSHREYFPGISIYDGDFYETPLGKIKINEEIRKELTYHSKFIFEGEFGHKQEHALEVQLPFLQFVLQNEFELIPIVMGDQKDGYVDELAKLLSKIDLQNVLIIASSDLSHYYSQKDAEFLDSRIEKDIREFNIEQLVKDNNRKLVEACGIGPMISLMKTMQNVGIKNSEVVYRTNSGETSLDFHQVVGYLSAIFY